MRCFGAGVGGLLDLLKEMHCFRPCQCCSWREPSIEPFRRCALGQASVACRDLLKQMLCSEPARRISIAGIMNHPWFLKDLPAGTHEMNARLQATDNVRCAAVSTPPPPPPPPHPAPPDPRSAPPCAGTQEMDARLQATEKQQLCTAAAASSGRHGPHR